MSFLKNLFGEISSGSTSTVEHPCSNCPSFCSICPDACSVCKPYKEKMIDAIYNVEHKDEILAKYEVTGTTASEDKKVVCPACGGTSANPYECEYCGTKLSEGTEKIQVASAKDLPNPVLDAQDIIFDRYNAISQYVDNNKGLLDSLLDGNGLFSSVLNAFAGVTSGSSQDAMGCKMTEDEINDMANYYGVSVSAYLTGLDNGKYHTLTAKNTESAYANQGSSSGLGLGAGLAGLAAAGLGVAGVASKIGHSNHGPEPRHNNPDHQMGRPDSHGGMGGPGSGHGGIGGNHGGMGRPDSHGGIGGPGGGHGGLGGNHGGIGGPGGGHGGPGGGPGRH